MRKVLIIMFEKVFDRPVDYFWEYEYSFGETFLKGIFGDAYKRKYSLTGNGIYNLLYLEDKIYEVKFTKGTSLLKEDNKVISDKIKTNIVNTIVENLKNKYTINSGKFITFETPKGVAKIEIIKKMKEPS